MKYYSALEKKETLSFVTTKMNLEEIRATGVSQSQKEKYCRSPLL